MKTELLVRLLTELDKRNLYDKYKIVYPREKSGLSFIFSLNSSDIELVLSLPTDISKIQRMHELKEQVEKINSLKNEKDKVLVK